MSLTLPAGVALPVTASALVLTQQPGNGDNGGQGEDFGKSSPVGVVMLIRVVVRAARLRKKTSATPLVSPATRLVAVEVNTTKRPSALIRGSLLWLFAAPPFAATLSTVVSPRVRSRK